MATIFTDEEKVVKTLGSQEHLTAKEMEYLKADHALRHAERAGGKRHTMPLVISRGDGQPPVYTRDNY